MYPLTKLSQLDLRLAVFHFVGEIKHYDFPLFVLKMSISLTDAGKQGRFAADRDV
jgi:hypothetical protein